MDSGQWTRIAGLFHQAHELPPAERLTFLQTACGGDEAILREVQALLAASAEATGLDSVVAQAFEDIADELGGALPSGHRIGHYALLEQIGKGGMGVVYRAVREDEFRMEVAVKLLKRGVDSDQALSRFRAERQILAQLQHPNIARLLDGGATENGLPYLVMEYVRGAPLLEHARPLPIRERLVLFRQVCAAVQYAHQNLVIHRDIKPANILVTPDGTPKLLDFGIARILDPDEPEKGTVTMAGMRPMTPDYASPEQVRGEPLTTATDIYSLGAALYELVTGTPPHHVHTWSPSAIETEICKNEPKKPSSVAPNIDADLENLILMALRKEPHRRYASAEQFSDDIRLYLEGRPIRARKDTLRYRASKFLRRNRTGAAVAMLAVAGLVSGTLAVKRQADRAEYRFQQVRRLANKVLFDLNREIENLAGSTRAREVLVGTSIEYLDSLAADAADDAGLQLELATAYEKIGDVLGNPAFSNLGHPQRSLESYGRALALVGQLPRSAPVMELSARTRYKTGCVYNWALRRVAEARRNLQEAARLADSIPTAAGEPAWRVRAEAHGFLGDMETYMDAQAALPPLRRSLGIAGEWVKAQPDAEARYFLAVATSRMGVALQENGDLSGALDHLLSALHQIEQLLDTEPENAVWKRESHALYDRLGWVTGHPQYFNLGDRNAAAGWEARLLAGAEEMAAADPANARARLELSEALAASAAVSRESDPSAAAEKYRRSLRLNASVLESTPDDANAAYWQSFNRVGFAWVLERLGRRLEALAELDAAVAMIEKLARLDPGDDRLREYLGLALHTRASHRMRNGDPSGAAQDLERSLGLLESLYRENPRRLSRLRDLAVCYQAMGDLYAQRSDRKLAGEWYGRSLALWDRWKEVGVSSVYDHSQRDAVARAAAKVALFARTR